VVSHSVGLIKVGEVLAHWTLRVKLRQQGKRREFNKEPGLYNTCIGLTH
jgi:hypothetical protein